jgi:hypothetical protein
MNWYKQTSFAEGMRRLAQDMSSPSAQTAPQYLSIREIGQDAAYDMYVQSYEKRDKGNGMPVMDKQTFLSRAKNWRFYGDATGWVAVRPQQSGMLKLVATAGNPMQIVKALDLLNKETAPLWGAVDEKLANAAKRYGFKSLRSKFIINKILAHIPANVFGSAEILEVTDDGGIKLKYKLFDRKKNQYVDVITIKYIIGNETYFNQMIDKYAPTGTGWLIRRSLK